VFLRDSLALPSVRQGRPPETSPSFPAARGATPSLFISAQRPLVWSASLDRPRQDPSIRAKGLADTSLFTFFPKVEVNGLLLSESRGFSAHRRSPGKLSFDPILRG